MDGLKDKLKHTGLGANKRTALIILALILIPMAVGITAREQSRRNNSNANQEVLAETQANEIIKKVGALMELPNEEPTVATVSDVSKLSDQQFFAKAQNGDKVIIFPKAQKAILYRPSTNKIIEIALYTPPSVSPQPQVSVQPSPRSLQDLVGGSPTPAPSVSPSISPSISPTPTP